LGSKKNWGGKNWIRIFENYEKYKNIIFNKTGFDNIFKCPESQKNFQKNDFQKIWSIESIHTL